MREQMAKLGLSFEFVDATDERKGLTREEAGLLGEDDISKHKRHLVPGALGCLISHLRCYKKLLESGSHRALILEDDAIMNEDFIPMLRLILTRQQSWNLLHLGYRLGGGYDTWIGKETLPLNFLLRRKLSGQWKEGHEGGYYQGPTAFNIYGTYGYLINPKACRKLLKQAKRLYRPIDNLLNVAGVPQRHAILPVLIEHSWEDESTIGYKGKFDSEGIDGGDLNNQAAQEPPGSRSWHSISHRYPRLHMLLCTMATLLCTQPLSYYVRILKNQKSS